MADSSSSAGPSLVHPPQEPSSFTPSTQSTADPSADPSPSTAEDDSHKPTCIMIIGMAGSGKTTLLQRLNAYLHQKGKPPYILNLDPAVTHMPYEANIDIRDTVEYKEVMKQYNLGPNGGILTALNLFTTKFDQVLGFVEKRAATVDHILLDTPGQIEIFTWSASGAIITDALASAVPTVVAYVIDTPRTTSPVTFMSNMLYACSILYKTRLPFIILFNKTDVQPADFAIDWMRDYESFQAALREADRGNDEGTGEMGYLGSLMGGMVLVLEEFYNHLRAVGVSAMTGQGMKEFFEAVDEARKEYETDYKPELLRLAAERKAQAEQAKKKQMDRMMRDLSVSASDGGAAAGPSRSAAGQGKGNPFGPHGMNERSDRLFDEEAAGGARHAAEEDDEDGDNEDEEEDDEEERRQIARQMEEEEMANEAGDEEVDPDREWPGRAGGFGRGAAGAGVGGAGARMGVGARGPGGIGRGTSWPRPG